MIIDFLNEDINIPAIDKEYKKNYSDIPEDIFMSIVKMDPNSYPKNGSEFDLTKEPIKVGNLASGSGLLLRCYKNGETDFINDFKRVQDACLKFTKNRGSFEYKNAAVFPSVKSFVEYVESDGKADIGIGQTQAEPQKKKAQTPEEKLEILRQKQFPKIETLAELIAVADLDEESDVEHGQIGNIARNLLLPHYAAGERDFLNKKVSLKKAISRYYNLDKATLKDKPLNGYETVVDFIKDNRFDNGDMSNFMMLLHYLSNQGDPYQDNCYKVVCITPKYEAIQYSSQKVGYIVDRCDYPYKELVSKFDLDNHPENRDEALDFLGENISSDNNMATNRWCTGWSGGSYAPSYGKSPYVLIAFIAKDRTPFGADNGKNWQISVDQYGSFKDVESGQNFHTQKDRNIRTFLTNMLPQNLDLIPYLLQYEQIRKNDSIMQIAKDNGITNSKSFDMDNMMDADWISTVEVEPEPLHYTGSDSLILYKESSKDENFANITEIIIDEGVEKIPNFEFQDFLNLKKVVFPTSLKEIGHKAFSGCQSLVRLNLPPNLERIGMGAFEACPQLRGSIRLPLSLKKIGQKAFANYLMGNFQSAVSQRIKFTLSPKRLDEAQYPEPLLVDESEAEDFVSKISLSDN